MIPLPATPAEWSAGRILLVEDEESIRMALQDDLGMEGYQVDAVGDGLEALAKATSAGYDLIILDLMLPRMDGFEVCRQLRAARITTPVLMLTARTQEIDRVTGLELGADDYVTKPFSRRELLARVRAILRRTRPPVEDATQCTFGDVRVDFRKHEATRAGRIVPLTGLEFALLRFLYERRDRVVSRTEILEHLWDDATAVFPRTVDTHLANLRRKLEDDPGAPRWLVGVRGIGYRFAE